MPHLKRGAIRDFLSIMESQKDYRDERYNKTDFIYTFETGSKIEFFSADSPDKVRGPRRDILFINEANNVSFETYTQLAIRTNETIYLDYNPVTEFWVHDEIINKGVDHDFEIITYKDNEGCPPSIVQELESRRQNTAWARVYLDGLIGELEGRVYKGWGVIDEIPHEARLESHALDFGFDPDPAAIIDVYYYNGGYILDEVLYQRGLHNSDLAKIIKNLPSAPVIADSAEPKSISDLGLFGISVIPTKKGPDSKRWGIDVMQNQRISYTKRSLNLQDEYRKYMLDKDSNDRFIPGKTVGHDDALDAARYGITSRAPVLQRKDFMDSLPRHEPLKRVNPGA